MNLLYQDWLALLLLFSVTVTLVKWHLRTDNQFDLSNLICTDGKLNDKKFMRTGAFIVMTYGFYAMIEDGKLTEAYAVLYGTLWVGNAALDKWQRQKEKE